MDDPPGDHEQSLSDTKSPRNAPPKRFSAAQIHAASAPQTVPYVPMQSGTTPWWHRLLKAVAWFTWFVGPAAPPPSTLEAMGNQQKQSRS
ncbi:hypothetical protein [Mycobacteroides saopaulense]|uniref:hypothetical protein n=1 Tax=Mycobacteroides saopaulense TaxID=1578165 RepID=UPI0012FFA943|nr:hypothetical protein [Mycobacteroides saopaulense]